MNTPQKLVLTVAMWMALDCLADVAEVLPTQIKIDSVTYESVRWSRVTPATVTMFHSKGVWRVPLEKLPVELQARFGFNPTNAVAYRTAEIRLMREAAEQADVKRITDQETRVSQEAARSRADQESQARVAALRALERNSDTARRAQEQALEMSRRQEAEREREQQRLRMQPVAVQDPFGNGFYLGPAETAPRYVDVPHWVQEVSNSGRFVLLENDSMWEVDPLATIRTMMWLPVDRIRLLQSDRPDLPWLLLNERLEQTVAVRRLR